MTDRKEVEALLAESRAHTGRKAGLIAELCRTWLAVKDAPVAEVSHWEQALFAAAGATIPDEGRRVRYVMDPTP